MNIKDIKKLILTSKKDNVELSKAYAAILKHIEAATIGVKNPETDEEKLILNAAKKELKEQEQSKSFGAPYSTTTIGCCSNIVKELSPTLISEEETRKFIEQTINNIEGYCHADMKQIMGFVKNEQICKNISFDMKLVSQIANELLKAK